MIYKNTTVIDDTQLDITQKIDILGKSKFYLDNYTRNFTLKNSDGRVIKILDTENEIVILDINFPPKEGDNFTFSGWGCEVIKIESYEIFKGEWTSSFMFKTTDERKLKNGVSTISISKEGRLIGIVTDMLVKLAIEDKVKGKCDE